MEMDAFAEGLKKNRIRLNNSMLVNEVDCGPQSKVNALKEAGILRPDMTIYEAEQMFGTSDWENIRARNFGATAAHPEDGRFLSIALEKSDWGKLNGKYKDKQSYQWYNFGSVKVTNPESITANTDAIKHLNNGGVIQVNGTVNNTPSHHALLIKNNNQFSVNDSLERIQEDKTSTVNGNGIESSNSFGINRRNNE
jgi:hypothetical protein